MATNYHLTFEVGEFVIFQKRSGAKIDQFQFARFQVDNQVFVLDISMNDVCGCAGNHRLDDLKTKDK